MVKSKNVLWSGHTYFFGIFSVLVRLSCRRSLHAIGSFFLRRHGKHKQHPVSSSSSVPVIFPSPLVCILFVFRQQNTFAKHNAHFPRSFTTVALAAFANSSARLIVCSSIVVISSIIFFGACLLLRLQHFNRFQQVSAASVAFVSLSCKMDVAISVAFCSLANFFERLQHDDFFNRRHGRHSTDA